MFYESLTDAELIRVVTNGAATELEQILAERLRRALAECDDLKREIEDSTPPDLDF